MVRQVTDETATITLALNFASFTEYEPSKRGLMKRLGFILIIVLVAIGCQPNVLETCTLKPHYTSSNGLPIDSGVGGVLAQDNRGYMTMGTKFLAILDLSDPMHPLIINKIELNVDVDDYLRDLTLVDPYLIISDYSSPSVILDVTNPNDVIPVTCDEGVNPALLVPGSSVNNYAYLPAEGYLDIYKTEQEGIWQKIYEYQPAMSNMSEVTPSTLAYTPPDLLSVFGVAVPKEPTDYIAIAEMHVSDIIWYGRVTLLDISDPKHPNVTDSFNIPDANSIGRIYPTENGFMVAGGPMYENTILYNLETTENGKFIVHDSITVRGTLYAADGSTFYVSDESSLMIYQINEDGSISQTGEVPYRDSTVQTTNGIEIAQEFAYIARGRDGLYIVDVSDIYQPEIVNHLFAFTNEVDK